MDTKKSPGNLKRLAVTQTPVFKKTLRANGEKCGSQMILIN